MSNTDITVRARRCPNCGLELPSSGWEGLCPRCLVSFSVRAIPVYDGRSAANERARPPQTQGSNATGAPNQQFGGSTNHSFGDYELLREVGRGGMGVVFKARQLSLNRTVAVKVLLAGALADDQRLERFRAEAEAIAQLHHPNIVAIYEAGSQGGTPFFSMEYVQGSTLAELVADRPLAADLAAQYVQTIARAIQCAHENGFLHRDLKPSNVLINSSGQVKVTDFGLAKRLPASSEHKHSDISAQLTLPGQVLGSPSYLAPEQAGHRGTPIGPAADIYALGAILFHLLTGRPPFLSETIEGTLLQVLTTEPVGVRRLNPGVPRDLETICSKCLQKEPARRYGSAQALGEDLGRFLEHRPILARPINPVERLWRWCQRRPALATILVLLHLSFALGFAGIFSQWRRARQSELSLQHNLYATDVNLAQVALEDNNLGRAAGLLQRYIPKSGADTDLRGFEWRYLWGLCQGDEAATLPGNGSIISSARYSPDGRLIASGSFDGTVTIWEAVTRRQLTQLTGLSGPLCRMALAFSPDGKLLAAAGGTNLLVWNTDRWTLARKLQAHSAPLGGGGYQVAFTPDGRKLAARLNEDVWVWEVATGRGKITATRAIDDTASLLAFSADGKTLATYWDNHVHFLDAETGVQRAMSVESFSQPFGLVFAPNQGEVAVVSASGTLRLIDPATGATTRSVTAHGGSAQGVAFSPDGKTVATCGADQLIRLWDFESLTNIVTLKGHRGEVWSVTFSPDGQNLASASKDGTVKLWRVQSPAAVIHELDYASMPLWYSADSRVLLTKSAKGSLHYWDVNSGQSVRAIPPLQTGAERYFTTVSSDGKYLATSVDDGRVFLWDLQAERCLWTNSIDSNPANAMAFSPDNQLLALSTGQYTGGTWQGDTKLLDVLRSEAETLSTEFSGTRDSACVAFSPDGKLLAGAGPDYSIYLWDVATRKKRATLKGHSWNVTSLAFSPDGKLLASAGNDSTARIWDSATGSEIASLTGHKTGVVQVTFSPDGRTLATSGSDRTVRLWSVATHRELLAIKSATGWTHILFSPDGHVLATGGTSGPLELWRAPQD